MEIKVHLEIGKKVQLENRNKSPKDQLKNGGFKKMRIQLEKVNENSI